MAEYKLIRTRRKSVSLRVTADAFVEVRAPVKLPKSRIDAFVSSKQDWIEEKLTVARNRLEHKAQFSLSYGDSIPILGRDYSLVPGRGRGARFDGSCVTLPPNLSHEEIKKALIALYRRLAKAELAERTAVYAEQMGLLPRAIKVGGAKQRWGSCSSTGNINFSWRLLMAGEEAVDYVVVHELSHLKQHDHSPRFWQVVASVLPDYPQRKEQLRSLQLRLAEEDWD